MKSSIPTRAHLGWQSALLGFSVLVILPTIACSSAIHTMTAHTLQTADAPLDPGTNVQVSTNSQSSAAPAPQEEAQVRIEGFQFSPATLTVPVGATVTWTNHDVDTHTVTSSTRAFSSAGLDRNETFSQRFTTPGTYAYFCALHPHMTAQIVVR